MFDPKDYHKIFHEIKNSITIINGSLQLIERQHPELTELDFWQESMDEVQHLRNLVTDLSYCHLQNEIHLEQLSVLPLLQQIHSEIRFFEDSSDFRLKMIVDDDLPYIFGDSRRLRQAIINLLKNSYEAMNCSGLVYLYAHKISDDICIAITDNGCGIDPAIQDKIFSANFSSKVIGTGLGLAITQEIIQLHHGTVTFHNNCDLPKLSSYPYTIPDHGCTFMIRLPAMRGSAKDKDLI